jgi:hypothetical protein
MKLGKQYDFGRRGNMWHYQLVIEQIAAGSMIGLEILTCDSKVLG